MIWLQPTPWKRWLLAGAALVVALWWELAPEPSTPHPFAIVDIGAGKTVDEVNTEMRQVPAGLLDTVDLGQVAIEEIAAGAPVLDSDLGDPGEVVPPGWWIVTVELPPTARVGDRARLVTLQGELSVEGIVASVGIDDAFLTGNGGVAIENGEKGAAIAAAAARGEVAVLISTG